MQDQDILIDLIARCALRDQRSLKKLYDKVSPYLNRVAYNIMKSDDLANDVLQEAFVQIWQNAGDYRPDKAKPLTWLTSITRYRALDRLAKEQKHADKVSVDAELDAMATEKSSPEDATMQSQQRSELMECIETLNERGKVCVTLAYLHGYSRDDLACKFETNVNTIKSWLHRGMKRLKQCLDQKATIA